MSQGMIKDGTDSLHYHLDYIKLYSKAVLSTYFALTMNVGLPKDFRRPHLSKAEDEKSAEIWIRMFDYAGRKAMKSGEFPDGTLNKNIKLLHRWMWVKEGSENIATSTGIAFLWTYCALTKRLAEKDLKKALAVPQSLQTYPFKSMAFIDHLDNLFKIAPRKSIDYADTIISETFPLQDEKRKAASFILENIHAARDLELKDSEKPQSRLSDIRVFAYYFENILFSNLEDKDIRAKSLNLWKECLGEDQPNASATSYRVEYIQNNIAPRAEKLDDKTFYLESLAVWKDLITSLANADPKEAERFLNEACKADHAFSSPAQDFRQELIDKRVLAVRSEKFDSGARHSVLSC